MQIFSPETKTLTHFCAAVSLRVSVTFFATSKRPTLSWGKTMPSSSWERWIISSTNVTSRAASVWIRPEKWGISSCLTIPLFNSSALPRMDCSGVFSSWDTFAVNSRRFRSANACSVTSKANSTVPTKASSDSIRLMSNWNSRPFRSDLTSLCPSDTAVCMAKCRSRLRFMVRKSCPLQDVSTPKTCCAAGLMLRIFPALSRRTRPSFMWLVTCANSSVCFFKLWSCAAICWRCWWMRLRRGANSS